MTSIFTRKKPGARRAGLQHSSAAPKFITCVWSKLRSVCFFTLILPLPSRHNLISSSGLRSTQHLDTATATHIPRPPSASPASGNPMNPTLPDKASSERYVLHARPSVPLFISLLTALQFKHAFGCCERAFEHGLSDVRIHPLLSLFADLSDRASNAKDQVMSAAGAAKDTVARQSQATVSDIQGLSASTHQAGNDLNAHPLTKYHSFRTSFPVDLC